MFNFLSKPSKQASNEAYNQTEKQSFQPVKSTVKKAVKKTAARKKVTTSAHHSLHCIGGYEIPIIKSARRKSIAVKRHKSGVVIEVPKYLSQFRIQASLKKHQSWLLDQINKHQNIEKFLFAGLPGQSFEYLGQTYYCHWSDETPSNTRKLCDYQICHQTQSLQMLFKNGLSQDKKQQLTLQSLETFFKAQAKSYLAATTDKFAEQMQLDYHSITIKAYKSRWGSCYPDGRLQYNWRLMQAPAWVVDYVVVHELAHRTHANHSRAFWNLVLQHYSATPAAKQQLKQHGSRWIQLLQS